MKKVKSLLFFLLSIPTFIFGQVVTDGLILNLDTRDSNSYSGSGNTWNDISGNNYNATINNQQDNLDIIGRISIFHREKYNTDVIGSETSYLNNKTYGLNHFFA